MTDHTPARGSNVVARDCLRPRLREDAVVILVPLEHVRDKEALRVCGHHAPRLDARLPAVAADLDMPFGRDRGRQWVVVDDRVAIRRALVIDEPVGEAGSGKEHVVPDEVLARRSDVPADLDAPGFRRPRHDLERGRNLRLAPVANVRVTGAGAGHRNGQYAEETERPIRWSAGNA